MKLYILTKAAALPQWVGTQAEARSLARELGPGWEWQPYDVPTSKDELLHFLNNCDVVRAATYDYVNAVIEERDADAAHETGRRPPTTVPTERGAANLRAGRECDDLVEFILEADGFVLSNLLGACVERLQRLRASIPA